MAARRTKLTDNSPAETLEALAQDALRIAKMARVHRKGLAGDNFYGNRLAELRTDAANAFRELATQSAGDTTALAELIESIFSTNIAAKDRLAACREISFSLRTTWKEQTTGRPGSEEDASVFPLTILTQANRGYLISVGRQMNGCFARGWYDACAVMMRRLLEISIIEAVEHKGIDSKIRDSKGDYLQLSDLISSALAEPAIRLSRNAKKALPQLRDVGHLSAHGRTFHARKEDIEAIRMGCRVVIEELLTHAGLL
jgi:hypothetical protein